MKHPRSLLRRAAGAAAVLVIASAALFNVGSSPARADQNTDIKFGPVTLTHVTDTGEAIPAPGRQLHKGDWFYLNADFDATGANPKPGQSFTIDLPEPFVNRDGGNSRGEVIKPLEYTDSKGTAVKAGECRVDRSRITCTFGEAIAGKVDVAGKIQAQLLAQDTTDRTSSVFTINGKEHSVAHPWNEDITLRPVRQFKPSTRLAKSAKGVGTNSPWINWRVLLGGSWLKANYPNGGPVTATDVIQDGLEVPDPSSINLVEIQAGPDGTGETERVVATADGKIKKDGYGIQASSEGRTVTFKVTGTLSTAKNYRIDFDTRFTGGGRIVPGHEYRNQVHLVEANKDTNVFTRSYFESFKATITYRQGFGGFQVTKASAGGAVPPAGQKFDVTVAYTLPGGKTAADFPGWEAPANPSRMTVTVGQTTPSGTFPAGTEITLTEDVATANPAATDLVWGAPKFSSEDTRVTIGGDGTSATFTVVDQTTLPVLLTNNATRTTGGVAAPPAAPPAPDPQDPATTGPADPIDPGADDPVDSGADDPVDSGTPAPTVPSESATATPQPLRTPPASPPGVVPEPIRPGLPRTGHNG